MSNWANIGPLFQTFIKRVEGGYVDHPSDPGGKTNMGVTIGAFEQLAPSLLGIPGTVENLKKLTDAQHLKILKYYWDNAKGEQYANPAIAAYATELAWGSGPGGAKKMLRNAAKAMGVTLSSASTMTGSDVAALNKLSAPALFDAITTARINFYKSLSTWAVFGKGWTNRINDFVNTFKKKVAV